MTKEFPNNHLTDFPLYLDCVTATAVFRGAGLTENTALRKRFFWYIGEIGTVLNLPMFPKIPFGEVSIGHVRRPKNDRERRKTWGSIIRSLGGYYNTHGYYAPNGKPAPGDNNLAYGNKGVTIYKISDIVGNTPKQIGITLEGESSGYVIGAWYVKKSGDAPGTIELVKSNGAAGAQEVTVSLVAPTAVTNPADKTNTVKQLELTIDGSTSTANHFQELNPLDFSIIKAIPDMPENNSGDVYIAFAEYNFGSGPYSA